MKLPLRAALLAALALAAVPAAATAANPETATITSKAPDGVKIVVSVYKPDGATAENPAPVILHSHGWAGSRTSSATAFQNELKAGYGVVSIDQRGHGQSGGQANVEDPNLEGLDMVSVIDYVAGLDWVAKDPGTTDDPVLFAMGGSYGGGYQFVAAFREIMDTGRTRLNAIAPEITWYDLPEALAPQKVVRTAWASLLYAAGAKMLPTYVHQAFAYGLATGQWPDGTAPDAAVPNLDAEFHKHGPVWHAENGRLLNIPVLFGQGLTDNLFNLNQGWKNMEKALTAGARSNSLFVGYNGGHALPNALPLGTTGSGDACSGEGGFAGLRMRFFEAVRKGEPTAGLLPARYNLSTQTGECIRTASLDQRTTYPIGTNVQVARGAATTTGAGAPQNVEIVKGPITVSGIPTVNAKVYTLGADQRVFFGLAVGATPATATVVQNNVMPLRELTPVLGESRTIELPGVAVKVPAGQSLYLTISPVSDMFAGHGTRTPGAVGLDDLKVNLPLAAG